ncbi:hypothetical protein MKK63_23995 [Methylobacterium sp. J-088]|uniref:hypothetical protein n=1 Tax=Methylobacterium sp. J-088 TaxID=2836664 RepID=UPI001FB963DF|nr:hypothetical protein [Methylobacterium sp. J-088]MCJ2065741.1 hypothetical protein [Methylobacterium sp. J-088]
MRIREIETRLERLEAKRGTGQFAHLSYEQVERALFTRLHRLATEAGGIDALMDGWDAAEDPEERRLIARIRSHPREIGTYYRDLEARLS